MGFINAVLAFFAVGAFTALTGELFVAGFLAAVVGFFAAATVFLAVAIVKSPEEKLESDLVIQLS